MLFVNLLWAATLLVVELVSAQIVLFPYSSQDGSPGNPVDAVVGFGNTTAISAACAVALNQTVACDPTLQYLSATGASLSPNSTGSGATLCNPACNSSLTTYHSSVATACGSTPVFTPQLANSWRGDLLQSYYNLVCTKDKKSGEFCSDWLSQQYASLPIFSDISAVPQDILCSNCQVSYFQTLQSSPFLGYGPILGTAWQTAQKICGLNLPTEVNPASNLTFRLPTVPQATANTTCLSGQTYTVQSGDTCASIASSNSVAEGTLWAINNLRPNCAAMSAGQSLCLPNKCQTYTMTPSDTCVSVAVASNNSLASFLNYNPTINSGCSNLNISGSVVCLTNPSGDYTPVYVPEANNTSIGEYATEIVSPPGPTPFGTTANCGEYYQVQVADTCERISLSASVSVALFELINPSIDANCFNLVPALWYCIHPIVGWNITVPTNATATPTTEPPPGPTPSGATDDCFEWAVIGANETCVFLQETLGITMAELMAWNPSLDANCDNLILGDAYCVSGPSLTSSSVAASSTTTSSPATTTATSTRTTTSAATTTSSTSTCQETYTVKSGDTCFAIWTEFGLTEAQFLALNPTLNSNCAIDAGEVLCV